MSDPRLFCDVTQSWSDVGGGVGTYLRHKRAHLIEHTDHRHLMILPGRRDELVEEGRAITVRIRSPRVPGSPQYRLLLRNRAVRRALEQFGPALVECQDAYNLPWAALKHGRRHPEVALVAGYFTDFPTVYVDRPFSRLLGRGLADRAARAAYRYCGRLYGRFDAVFGLSEHGGVAKLRTLGVEDVDVLPLGVQLDGFHPDRRDTALRAHLGVGEGQPLLIYAGRLDGEKRAAVVVDAFRRLPRSLGATLVLLGDGPLREHFVALGEAGERIHAPGYVRDRDELARWLASADIYVSGMADETFGISIIEAQAAGLPVVGVEAGAMIDRVNPAIGRLGPVDDSSVMAANLLAVWKEGPAAMGQAARAHVAGEFSWSHSMDVLFGTIYPKALAKAAERARSSPV
ncbi:glycosyltransferase family 1 protein [Sphingomonas ginkgonis]|uniref:Glycosyltransferase family 1 protein n=1 Tax=Sphingomonas ginkgonis TaxID=2315330 RepID=A0A429V8L8_9SPHN|nr:glycosyltransferase [Sphingomonas ginkgonis]RST30299.1 glycosyltransferase family 1 protein [Sphingomonas ginkgonis]